MAMFVFAGQDGKHNETGQPGWQTQVKNQRNLGVQVVVSLALGASAFLGFCILRTRWTNLYGARKKQTAAAARLPDLPNTFFGWMPVLWRISDTEVLASAGLDAYIFLAFFRYASKFLGLALFFSLAVILPINYRYTGDYGYPWPLPGNSTNSTIPNATYLQTRDQMELQRKGGKEMKPQTTYLWMYVAFTYFFSYIAINLLVAETKHIIKIRQAYLGTQATITDKTLRLSGIPDGMRTVEKIKDFIEDLGIGKVDNVMICKNWRDLEDTVAERMACLRKLEQAWATYLGFSKPKRAMRKASAYDSSTGQADINGDIMSEEERDAVESSRKRPMHTIRYGFLKLQSKAVDSIDYHTEKLRKLDEQVRELRKKEFEPTPMAYVTMESVAACQMAVQAILDPLPGQFLVTQAPPPIDVVWRNTYLSRNDRMFRSWSIMLFIGLLSIFWAALVIPIAGLLSIEVIDKVLPGFGAALERHDTLRALVQTSLPTIAFSLLAIGVPYLYDWLSNLQGMTSQGEVELSLISKNFFFTFFNLFIVFTIFGTASTFYDFWNDLQDVLKDTSGIAYALAGSLEKLSPFYINLIVLQGLGLLPFRLLQFGAVSLYPVWLFWAVTPRDYQILSLPPMFSYAYFLPQTILIFVICLVYSVLPSSWMITLFGLIYFIIGGFIYKYQLLYAMDHRQHSTGRGWPMICNRIMIGLYVFQVAMVGILALKGSITKSILLVPLVGGTVWYQIYFTKTYHPLMNFIALRSIDRESPLDLPSPMENPWDRDTDRGRTVDTDPETGLRYMNPHVSEPLEDLWVSRAQADPLGLASTQTTRRQVTV